MSTNPLKNAAKPKGNLFRASEYAAQARALGLTKHAEAWDKADREGWDEKHYDPMAAAEYKKRVAEKRRHQ